jgi:hypothetical protein
MTVRYLVPDTTPLLLTYVNINVCLVPESCKGSSRSRSDVHMLAEPSLKQNVVN